MQILGITENKGRNYISYTLENSQTFYEVGYKSVRAGGNTNFLQCNYMTLNGQIRLLYHTEHYFTLASAAASMSANAFANLLVSIFDSVLEIKNSSFINIETVDLEPQKLYVDMDSLKPYFIYVPVYIQSSREHYYAIMDYLKKSMTYLIQTNANLQSDLTTRIAKELSDYNNSTENLKSSISELLGIYRATGNNPNREILYADKKVEVSPAPEQVKENEKSDKKRAWFKHDKKKEEISYAETSVLSEEFVSSLRLISTDSTQRLEFIINKREYLIGHKAGEADGCIESNSSVSRKHCKICNINGKNYVIDLNSTNGTFVNGMRISPEQAVEIAPGDKIRIANVEFLVSNDSGR